MTAKRDIMRSERPVSLWDNAVAALNSAKITPEHVTKVLEIVDCVVQARVEAGLEDTRTTNRLREMAGELQKASLSADRAADLFDRMHDDLSEDERGSLAAMIIKVQLGVSPDKL